jgi:MFS family permease
VSGTSSGAYLLGKRRTLIVFAGLLLEMLLAALNQTIVATALPDIVADLGGFDHYSWVFSAYMLTSTVTSPSTGSSPTCTAGVRSSCSRSCCS